jgi:hypothetical protein
LQKFKIIIFTQSDKGTEETGCIQFSLKVLESYIFYGKLTPDPSAMEKSDIFKEERIGIAFLKSDGKFTL